MIEKSIGIVLLIALASFAAAFTLSRRISAAIAALRTHAVALGMGETDTPVTTSGPAEIQGLADAFNIMPSTKRLLTTRA